MFIVIEKEFTIREPKPTLLFNIITSLIFIIYVSIVYYTIYNRGYKIKVITLLIMLTYYVFRYMIIPRISTNYIHINFGKQKIKFEKSIGPFNLSKKWQDLKDLEYLSVFKIHDGYRANLWYETNNIINLFVLQNKDEAFKNAYTIANKLDIDLLDATNKGNHQWVDKIYYEKEGEIKHL